MKKGAGVYQFIMSKYFINRGSLNQDSPNQGSLNWVPDILPKKDFLNVKVEFSFNNNNPQDDALYLYKNKWYDFLENLSTNFSVVLWTRSTEKIIVAYLIWY